MLQKCAGIRKYTEELPNFNVTAFDVGDILLSNIRPYLQKLWQATFSGGCSNDVLVLRVKDATLYNADFYAKYLMRSEFFEYIMQDVNGVKMPRGNKVHIMRYIIPTFDIETQNKAVTKINAIEAQIAEAEKKLDALKGKTSEILERYLK